MEETTETGAIEVDQQLVDGTPGFRARARAEVPPAALLAVTTDLDAATGWSRARLLESRVLARRTGRACAGGGSTRPPSTRTSTPARCAVGWWKSR